MLFSNLLEISCPFTEINASSCNLEIAVVDAWLFCLFVFVSYIFLQLSLHLPYCMFSVSSRCLCVHMNDCAFNRWPFLLPAVWRNLSSFLRLLSHNTSAAPIPAKRNGTITLSPRHPGPRLTGAAALQVRSF